MRPAVQQQQPHHFIRRWPRARREKRGPSVKVMDLVITMTRAEILHAIRVVGMTDKSSNAQIAGALIGREAVRICPRNWTMGGPHGETTIVMDDFSGGMTIRKSVRFYRKAM